jgi:phage terminase small subunit
LTIKQKKFKEGIVAKIAGKSNKTNTQIAKDAGYSEKTAYSIANENLNKPEIKNAIDKRIAELELKTDFDVEFVRKNMLLGMNETFEKKDFTNFKGFVELMAKHKAMLTDKLVTAEEPKLLSAKEIEDVEELAKQYAEKQAKIKLVG